MREDGGFGVLDGQYVGGSDCRKLGAFGAALRGGEIHKSWCRDCEQALLTRGWGVTLCARCRAYRKRTATRRARARAGLALYWVKLGLL